MRRAFGIGLVVLGLATISLDTPHADHTTNALGRSFGGGATLAVVGDNELLRHSEIAFEAEVVEVHDTIFNTSGGDLPNVIDHLDLERLLPITEVTLRVNRLLGANPATRLTIADGDQITVAVVGGVAEQTVEVQYLTSAGVSLDEMVDDDQKIPRPDSLTTFGVSMAAAVDLAVGDVGVFFVASDQIPWVGEQATVSRPVFVGSGQGIWIYNNGTARVGLPGASIFRAIASIESLASQLSSRLTPPLDLSKTNVPER